MELALTSASTFVRLFQHESGHWVVLYSPLTNTVLISIALNFPGHADRTCLFSASGDGMTTAPVPPHSPGKTFRPSSFLPEGSPLRTPRQDLVRGVSAGDFPFFLPKTFPFPEFRQPTDLHPASAPKTPKATFSPFPPPFLSADVKLIPLLRSFPAGSTLFPLTRHPPLRYLVLALPRARIAFLYS